MLKYIVVIEKNIDISKFPKLKIFLKRRNDDYKSKKSLIFSRISVGNDKNVKGMKNS